MIHLFIWREWDTMMMPKPVGHWEHWKSLPAEIAKSHLAYLRGLGLEVEYTGF